MKKLTISELKDYIISEAHKLYAVEVLKEEKKIVEKELSLLSENSPNEYNMDYETLKKVRQEMLKKAAGWDFSQPKQLDEKKYSDKASNFIGKEISHLEKDKGYEHDKAVAAAINIAKDKGYKVPGKTNEIDKSAIKAAKKDIEATGQKFNALGKDKFEKNINKKELEKSMSPEKTNEDIDSSKMYYFKLKHDGGIKNLKTTGSSMEAAKQKIAAAEGAPEHAVQFIKEV